MRILKNFNKLVSLICVLAMCLSLVTHTFASGYVCEIKEIKYTSLLEAMKNADGKTINLTENAILDLGTIPEGTKFTVDGDGKYKITLAGDVTLSGYGTDARFTNVTVDLNKRHFILEKQASMTLMSGAVLENGYAYKESFGGGAAEIKDGCFFTMEEGSRVKNCYSEGVGGAFSVNAAKFTMTGGTIENCTAETKGGALAIVNDGIFEMNGGSIKGNGASIGGGVYIGDHKDDKARAYISGNATIKGNTLKGSAVTSNVQPLFSSMLVMAGDYFGEMGITFTDGSGEGSTFGVVSGSFSGADKVINDSNTALKGAVAGKMLVWSKDGSVNLPAGNTSGSSGTNQSTTQGPAKTPSDITFGTGVICEVGGKEYNSLYEAIMNADKGTINLKANTTIDAGTTIPEGTKFTVDGGGKYVIRLLGDVKLTGYGVEAKFSNVTVDLNKHHFALEKQATMTLKKGAILENGYADANSHGGGAAQVMNGCSFTMEDGSYVRDCESAGPGGAFRVNAAKFKMLGGTIENCTAGTNGGALAVVYDAELTMSGGSIKGNSAQKGAGVYIGDHSGDKAIGYFSGSATVTGNKISGSSQNNNVQPFFSSMLVVMGNYTGKMGVTMREPGGEGAAFAAASGSVTGANNITNDSNAEFTGSVSGSNIVWVKDASSGASTQAGSSASSSTVTIDAPPKTPSDIKFGTGAVCEVGGKEYSSLIDAINNADNGVINLKANTTLDAGTKITEGKKFTVDGGGKYVIRLLGDVTLTGYGAEARFSNVTVDLNKHHFALERQATMTLKKGAILENGYASSSTHGGGAAQVMNACRFTMEEGSFVRDCTSDRAGGAFRVNAATFEMKGGTITNCTAGTSGGALAIVYDANLIMSGGIIKGNRAEKGAGIYVGDHSGDVATAKISGGAVITGNTLKNGSAENNVQTFFPSMLVISGAYTGEMGVTMREEGGEGSGFASLEGAVSGLDKIYLDKDKSLKGAASGSNAIWSKNGAPVSGSQSGNAGTSDKGTPSCYIGTNTGKTYTNLAEAISKSKGDTIHLLGDMTWSTGSKSIDNTYFTIDGHGYKVSVSGDVKIYQSSHVKLKDVTVDLGGKTNFFVHSTGKLTLMDGAVIENGKAANGGGILIQEDGEVYMEKGSIVRKNFTAGGGGGIRVHDGGLLVMKGGTVTENTAGDGAGIYVTENGKVVLSGDVIVEGNKDRSGNNSNLVLQKSDYLILRDEITGSIGVNLTDSAASGTPFALISGNIKGVTKLYSDTDEKLVGSIKDGKVVLASKSGAKDSGSGEVIYEEPSNLTIEFLTKDGWSVEANSGSESGKKNLIDGNYLNHWHSSYKVENNAIVSKDDPPFDLDVTLPEETVISGFAYTPRVEGGAGVPSHIKFYMEENGEWKELGDYEIGSVKGTRRENFICNIAVKKVRLQILDGMGGYGSLAEIDLLEANPLNKTVSGYDEFKEYSTTEALYPIDTSKAKATYDGGHWAGNIIDNVLDGTSSFFQNQNATSREIYVDLGAVYNLSAVSYEPRLDGSPGYWYDYTIYASDDGEEYYEVGKKFAREFSAELQYTRFDETVTTRYFKFVVNRSYNGLISCTDLRFYENYEEHEKRVNAEKETYTLVIGNKEITHKNGTATLDTAPYIENGTTFIPLRGLLELMGAEITWDEEVQGITVVKGDIKIYLQIMYKNVIVTTPQYGEAQFTLLAEPRITDNRTFVPIRFISEQLGYNVSWDGVTKTVTITN